MNTPKSQREFLLKAQSDANCANFESHFKRFLVEWNRSVDQWEAQATVIRNLQSQKLLDGSKNILTTLTEILKEILILSQLQSKYYSNPPLVDAIKEYCRDAEQKLLDGNNHLQQSYNCLVTGNVRQAENLIVLYVAPTFESSRSLLRLGCGRIEYFIRRQNNLRKAMATIFYFAGNTALWGFGSFFVTFYATKLPAKVLTFASLFGLSCFSLYHLHGYNNPPSLQSGIRNKCSKSLNDFIEAFQ